MYQVFFFAQKFFYRYVHILIVEVTAVMGTTSEKYDFQYLHPAVLKVYTVEWTDWIMFNVTIIYSNTNKYNFQMYSKVNDSYKSNNITIQITARHFLVW